MTKQVLEVEVDVIELALRLAEAACEIRRPDGVDHREAWARLVKTNGEMCEAFLRQAHVAAGYFGECVRAHRTYPRVQ